MTNYEVRSQNDIISFKAPEALREKLDDLTAHESNEIGYEISRSSMIRKLLSIGIESYEVGKNER